MKTKEEISKLSNDELKTALKSSNISCGPITSTTRRIYENRYFSYLQIQKQKKVERQENIVDRTEDQTEKKILEDTEIGNASEKINSTEVLCNGIAQNIDENHFGIDNQSSRPIVTKVNNNSQESSSSSTKNIINEKSTIEIGDGFFYGVWVPFSPTRMNLKNKPNVFFSKKSALTAMKKWNGSRFKQFKTKEEAEKFSLAPPNLLSVDSIISMVANTKDSPLPKPDPWKAPTIQEIAKFRKHIEANEIGNVLKSLDNPKYLINSKDFPVIVHEGSRLNALHVAVKYNRLSICEEIMNKVADFENFKLVNLDLDEESLKIRRHHVEKLYLNSPEKIVIINLNSFEKLLSYLLVVSPHYIKSS